MRIIKLFTYLPHLLILFQCLDLCIYSSYSEYQGQSVRGLLILSMIIYWMNGWNETCHSLSILPTGDLLLTPILSHRFCHKEQKLLLLNIHAHKQIHLHQIDIQTHTFLINLLMAYDLCFLFVSRSKNCILFIYFLKGIGIYIIYILCIHTLFLLNSVVCKKVVFKPIFQKMQASKLRNFNINFFFAFSKRFCFFIAKISIFISFLFVSLPSWI